MEEFYRLASHCDLAMTEEQQAAKYICDPKYLIKERVILHNVFYVNEAHNKALKVERLQSRTLPFRHPTSIKESTSGTGVHSSFTTVDRPPARQPTNTFASAPATINTV